MRAWGRLGYPRRALRLHAAATEVVARHGGELPTTYDGLVTLPGVGEYTAAAVASFAHGARHAVLDTNVRRVLARTVGGAEQPAPTLTAAERARAESVVPDDPATAARWAVAVMELGALVCTARAPGCDRCPVADRCAWRLAGCPAYDGPVRRTQAFAGHRPAGARAADGRAAGPAGTRRSRRARGVWAEPVQRDRALAGLLADGLLVEDAGCYRLP